jgi:branched-chain amino acid aminotransferase
VGFLNGWGVFSTLRVFDGVLFAYERHYARMKHDAERLRVPFHIGAAELKRALLTLVEANRAFNSTLRIAVVRNRGGLFEGPEISRDADVVAFTADLANWGAGVKLTYVPHARYGSGLFAGVKTTAWAQNLAINDEVHARGFDEGILLNEDGRVSECTSANIFAIANDRVSTPPLGTSGCLPGVTRAILLEEIAIPGLKIAERELSPSDLEDADQVFITSTTRDLLPVLSIDGGALSQKRTWLTPLQQAFAAYQTRYVAAQTRRDEMVSA